LVYCTKNNLATLLQIEFEYFGGFDASGRFHGQAVIIVRKEESCFKGDCKQEPDL
jgi:hypothetical protein